MKTPIAHGTRDSNPAVKMFRTQPKEGERKEVCLSQVLKGNKRPGKKDQKERKVASAER